MEPIERRTCASLDEEFHGPDLPEDFHAAVNVLAKSHVRAAASELWGAHLYMSKDLMGTWRIAHQAEARVSRLQLFLGLFGGLAFMLLTLAIHDHSRLFPTVHDVSLRAMVRATQDRP